MRGLLVRKFLMKTQFENYKIQQLNHTLKLRDSVLKYEKFIYFNKYNGIYKK